MASIDLSSIVRAGCVLLLALAVTACAAEIPRHYLDHAQRVPLSRLAENPDRYRGQLVILGGAVTEERRDDGHVWLRLKNRPLDADNHPHRPMNNDGPEAGHYWIVIAQNKVPARYQTWARMTVIGEVAGVRPIDGGGAPEPVLRVAYVRGWSLFPEHEHAWEEFSDPQYQVGTPQGIHGEFGGQ